MTAPKTKINSSLSKNRVVTPVKSIQVIYYACTNCDEEHDEVQLCQACKAPMKVIQVVEKFGADAEEYLKGMKVSIPQSISNSTVTVADSIVSAVNDDDLDETNKAEVDDEFKEFDEFIGEGIFHDDDDSRLEERTIDTNQDDAFFKAIEGLDDEDDEDFKDLDGLNGSVDDMPEL